MAKLLKYPGNITIDQEYYAINGTVVAGTIVEWDATNGGVKAASVNAVGAAVAGICEGLMDAAIGDAAALATGVGAAVAVVRPLLPGTIVEIAHATLTLKVGEPVTLVAGGATVAKATTKEEFGRVVEAISTTLAKVRVTSTSKADST